MRSLMTIFLCLVVLINTSFYNHISAQNNKAASKYITYIPWKSSDVGYWLTYNNYSVYNDFDYKISRTILPTKSGNYYYYVSFYSQSYYWDGYKANYTSTNVRNIKLSINDSIVSSNLTDLGITFNGTYTASSLTFSSKSKSPAIWISWENMKAK